MLVLRAYLLVCRNMHNLLDIVAFSLPMIASCALLTLPKGHYDGDVKAKTRILSYSVLAVFFHMVSA